MFGLITKKKARAEVERARAAHTATIEAKQTAERDRDNWKQEAGEAAQLVNTLQAEVTALKTPSPEIIEAMQEMGRQFAEQAGIDPDLLAGGIMVGPGLTPQAVNFNQ